MKIILLGLLIASSVFAQEVKDNSCRTQTMLANLSNKNLVGFSSAELYAGAKNITKGACKITWPAVRDGYAIQVSSNESVLYKSSKIFFDIQVDEEYYSQQIAKIDNAVEALKKALAACGCSTI